MLKVMHFRRHEGHDAKIVSDLTDKEWSVLEPILRGALYGDKSRTRGHPRQYLLREIVNAIMYILKTGCPWRQLPHDLPP